MFDLITVDNTEHSNMLRSPDWQTLLLDLDKETDR